MKQNFLRKMMLIAVLLTGSHAFAYDFEAQNSDGVTIYYNILSNSDRTVEVTYKEEYSDGNHYSGNIIIPERVTTNDKSYIVSSIGNNAFDACDTITNITIPNSVTSIGDEAFRICSGLTSVTIPNSVISLGKYAFAACNKLTNLTIGNSLTSIGMGAFDACRGLTEIICKSSTPPTADYYEFDEVSTTATLYVPIGSKEAYANATGWSLFTNIVEKEMSGVESTLTDNEINVSVENGNIIVNGAENANVEVYNTNGQCVYNGTATTIPVNAKGLFIVKANGKSFKVIL